MYTSLLLAIELDFKWLINDDDDDNDDDDETAIEFE